MPTARLRLDLVEFRFKKREMGATYGVTCREVVGYKMRGSYMNYSGEVTAVCQRERTPTVKRVSSYVSFKLLERT